MALVTVLVGLTPTDMSNFDYCSRLFYISKLLRQFQTIITFPLKWGSIEHEVNRILAEKFQYTWRMNPGKFLKEISQNDIVTTLNHVYNLAVVSHPHFSDDIKRALPELHYRLNEWINLKQVDLNKLLNHGYSWDSAISNVLPWKTEESVRSKKYELYGRIDSIYNDGTSLIPEDIKTHGSRFSSFIHQDSHKTQLVCYSLMLEEQFGMPSNMARILYSKDVSYVSVNASINEKEKLIEQMAQAREILTQDIPPLLQGEAAALKCKHCYARRQCFQLAKDQQVSKMIGQFIDPATIPTNPMEKKNGN